MKKAVEGLDVPADYALIDGNRMPPIEIDGEIENVENIFYIPAYFYVFIICSLSIFKINIK